MTTPRRAGNQPTPEQVAAGGPPPEINISSERRITTQPVPGQHRDVVVVTYRIAPNPPVPLIIDLEKLPHWVFLRDNPGKEVPAGIQAQGDTALRDIIRSQRQPAGPPTRMI